MATNGDAERLAQVERAIVGEIGLNRRPPADLAADLPEGTTDDVVARAEAVGALCREAGRYARDHGAYVDEICRAFDERMKALGEHVTALTGEFATKLMEAERRKLAEMQRIVGKIARP